MRIEHAQIIPLDSQLVDQQISQKGSLDATTNNQPLEKRSHQ